MASNQRFEAILRKPPMFGFHATAADVRAHCVFGSGGLRPFARFTVLEVDFRDVAFLIVQT